MFILQMNPLEPTEPAFIISNLNYYFLLNYFKSCFYVSPLSHVRLVPPAALPQQPPPVALRTGDAVLHARGAPPPHLNIQARLTPNPLSNLHPQQVPRCLSKNPHHHAPQVCMSMYAYIMSYVCVHCCFLLKVQVISLLETLPWCLSTRPWGTGLLCTICHLLPLV